MNTRQAAIALAHRELAAKALHIHHAQQADRRLKALADSYQLTGQDLTRPGIPLQTFTVHTLTRDHPPTIDQRERTAYAHRS